MNKIEELKNQLIEEIKKELEGKKFTISDFYKMTSRTLSFSEFENNVNLEMTIEENVTELSLEEVGVLLNDLNDTDEIEYFIKDNKIYVKETNTDVYRIK